MEEIPQAEHNGILGSHFKNYVCVNEISSTRDLQEVAVDLLLDSES